MRKKMKEKISISFGGLYSTAIVLTIVFAVLKLTGNITWGLIWIISPIWIAFLFLIVSIGTLLLVIAIMLAIVYFLDQ